MIYLHKKIKSVSLKIISGFLIVAFVMTLNPSAGISGNIDSLFKTQKAEAAFNKQINYQGKLTNSSNVAVSDGTYHMTFRLYTSPTAATTTNIWEEDRSTAAGNRVTVSNGLFSVMLGSSTPLTSVDFNQTLYLGVEVGGSGGSSAFDGEMTPRKILGAVPAAFESDKIDGLSSEQFLRSDAVNSTSTATTFLTVTQNGAGKIAEFLGPSSAPVLSILSNGNVGIGTTSPYAALSVAGQVVASYFTATSTTATSSFAFDVSVTGALKVQNSNNSTSMGYLNTVGTNAAAVGISNRAERGDVAFGRLNIVTADDTGSDGTASAFGISNNVSGIFSGAYGYNNTVSGDFAFAFGAGITNSTSDSLMIGPSNAAKVTILSSGNFGIGTTSPYAKLSVDGRGVFNQDVRANYFTATSTTLASTFPFASTTALTVSGTGGLYVGTLTGPLQAIGGAVTASSTISVAYGGTGVSTAPSYGQLLVGNSSGGYTLTATSSLGITSSQWVTSGNNIYNSNTASVGIGTSSPYSKLSVWGADTASTTIAEFVNSASTTVFSITGNGQLNLKGTAALPNFRIYNNNTDTYLGGLAVNGGNTYITGNPNEADATAGSVFIYGALGLYGELQQNSGATYIGTSVVSRPSTGPVVGGTPDQNFLGVGGEMTVVGYAQFNSSIIVGGGSANPTAGGASTISLQGQAARSIGVERNWTAATVGQALTINAGGARSAGTNLNGGNLTLRSGVPTGTGVSTLTLGTYGGGSSGTSDGTITNSLVLAHNSAVFATGVKIGVGTTSPYAALSVVGEAVAAYFTATTTTASTFPYASSTALTVSGTGGLYVGTLTGPLQAIGGAVTASSTISVAYGGTGLSTAPAYGQVLVGDSAGGYTLTATSSLGISGGSSQWTTSGSDIYYATAGGNVGIGTTSPYAKLSVDGRGVFNQDVRANYFTATSTTLASTFPYASTTALTVSGANGLTLGSLNGPLQAINGAVSASSTLSVAYGGTGVSTAPSYGQLLLGNATGGYDLTATTSLGITSSQWVTSGTDIYYSSRNVGVSTTSPWGKLSVTNTGTGPSFVVEDSASPDSTPFVVDASGNVGIGIAVPTATLDVVSGTTGTVRAAIFEGWSSGVTRFNFNNNVGLSLANSRSVNWSSGTNPTTGLDSGFSRIGVGVIAVGNGTVSDVSGTLVAAKVGVASSTPWRALSVNGTVAFNGLTSSATGNAVCIATSKDITDAGAASCVPSSVRFKENVETLTEGFALDTLNQLRVVSFDYKDGFYSPEDHKESYGMIAEEVEEIDPNLVDYGYDGLPTTLKFEKILGLTVQAVQELQHNFRLASGPDGNAGGLTIESVIRNLRRLGVNVQDGIAYLKGLVVETLTVGSSEKPTGITLYDEQTGRPFCVKVSGGKLKNISGTCEDAPDELDEEDGIEPGQPQTGRVRSGGSSAGSVVPAPEPIVEAVTELEGEDDISEVRQGSDQNQLENEDDNDAGAPDEESDESDSSNEVGVEAVSVSDASSAEAGI